MKIYIDTCIFSRLLDLKITNNELEALNLVSDIEKLEFITSEKTLEEFLNTKDDKRRKALRVLFRLVTKVKNIHLTQTEPALWGTIMWGEAPWGGGVTREKPLFKKLKNIFDADDSNHIFQAINNECDYFLTLDRKTILSRIKPNKNELATITKMQFVSPLELYAFVKML